MNENLKMSSLKDKLNSGNAGKQDVKVEKKEREVNKLTKKKYEKNK